MKQTLLALLLTTFFISPETVRAADFSASVGAIAISRPTFEGADDYEFDILPLIDISIGKSVFLNVERGLGVYFMKNRALEFGGSLGYYESRKEDDSTKLTGLGDIDAGIDGRIFGKIDLDEYSLSFQFQNDLSSNHDGFLFIIGAGYSFGHHTDVDWNVKATITFADDNYTQTYFGVNTTQTTQSGLQFFAAEGGLKDLALNSNFSRKIDRHWSLKGVVGYKLLVGDPSNSPLVENSGSEHQLRFGAGLVYKF